MKKALVMTLGLLMTVSASAQMVTFPDLNFDVMNDSQVAAIQNDANVGEYAAMNGGMVSVKKTNINPVIYSVLTASGCSFDANVVYGENFFDGIDDVTIVSLCE